MPGLEATEDACYRAELAAAERHMEETYGDGERDHRECPGWELGECWSCPWEGGCFPDLEREEE